MIIQRRAVLRIKTVEGTRGGGSWKGTKIYMYTPHLLTQRIYKFSDNNSVTLFLFPFQNVLNVTEGEGEGETWYIKKEGTAGR